ncbi:unnamed protein product [Closterium sp. NIES-53]
MAAQELRWLTYLLTNLGEQPRSPPQRGQLRLAYVATRANTGDIFTKALLPACFDFLDWSCDHLFSPTLPMGFYHPTSRRVLSSQDVTFDESVPYYRLFPYRTAPLPPPPLFLAPGPPPVDPLPPQGPAPSGVSQVDAVEPVEVAGDSGAATGAEHAGAGSGGTEPEGAEPGGAESGGAASGGAEPGGAESEGAEPGGAESGGAVLGGTEPGGAERRSVGSARVVSRGASSRRELLSPQELCERFARRWSRASGAAGPGADGPGGPAEAAGGGPPGGSAGASGGTGTAGSPGTGAAGATGIGAGGSADAGTSKSAGVGAARAGGAAGAGAPAGSPGAVPAGSGGATWPRPYFVPLLEKVLGLPPSPRPAPPLECPQPVQSQSQFQPVSPLPAPSPYTGPTGGLDECRAPASRPACTSCRTSRPRHPPVPGTHQMTLRPSTTSLRVPLPSPPASSLPVLADPESDSLRAASPTVARFLATVVTDPSLASTATSALVAELVDIAACCRLDYAASLVSESASVCPPSVGGECALSTDVLEDRQEEFQCFAVAWPHLVSTLLAPDAPDIPTLRSYAEAIEGTYVDEVPPPGANIVSGMWIFRVKRPPGSPPVFKARYVARGFNQRQGDDYFQTFSPTPKMTTLRVLLHVAAQRDYELHSLDFSTAFLQGSPSLGSGSVSWRSTRSSSVLGSSCEAEIYAGAMAAQELRWLTYLLTDLGEQPRSPPVLYVDNKAMLALCREHRLEHRTKHIALRYFLARELQQCGQLRLAYVASEANTADIFTKALPPGDHQRFCTMLGLVPTWPHLLTS